MKKIAQTLITSLTLALIISCGYEQRAKTTIYNNSNSPISHVYFSYTSANGEEIKYFDYIEPNDSKTIDCYVASGIFMSFTTDLIELSYIYNDTTYTLDERNSDQLFDGKKVNIYIDGTEIILESFKP